MANSSITRTAGERGRIRRYGCAVVCDDSDGSLEIAVSLPPGRIVAVDTDPGSPAPTDQYDITLVDQHGLDVLGGAGANRATATTERAAVTAGWVAADDTLTLTFANQSVNSAEVQVDLLMVDL